MKILFLEDLDSYAAVVISALEGRKSQLGPVDVERVATEYEFRSRLPELVEKHFDVAIFDVMVSWCHLEDFENSAAKELPPEVKEEQEGTSKWRGGARCYQLFTEALFRKGKRAVPSIFYTILEAEDLRGTVPENVALVTKRDEIDNLVDALLKATGQK